MQPIRKAWKTGNKFFTRIFSELSLGYKDTKWTGIQIDFSTFQTKIRGFVSYFSKLYDNFIVNWHRDMEITSEFGLIQGNIIPTISNSAQIRVFFPSLKFITVISSQKNIKYIYSHVTNQILPVPWSSCTQGWTIYWKNTFTYFSLLLAFVLIL